MNRYVNKSTRVEINIYCQTGNNSRRKTSSTRVEINIYCQTDFEIVRKFDLRE